MNRATRAWGIYQQTVKDRYLASVAGLATGDELRRDLEALAIIAGDPTASDDQQNAARDEAERALLWYIGDPEVSAMFYDIRKRCV